MTKCFYLCVVLFMKSVTTHLASLMWPARWYSGMYLRLTAYPSLDYLHSKILTALCSSYAGQKWADSWPQPLSTTLVMPLPSINCVLQ